MRWWPVLIVASLAACSSEGGGGGDDRPDAQSGGDDDGVDADLSGDQFSVVGANGFLAVPPPACTGEWVDYGCDGRIPLECTGATHIGADQNAPIDPCPICLADSPADPTTCEEWETAYGHFLAASISASCANYCDDTQFSCAGWKITNSCGTFALALTANIDEEIDYFSGEFAAENCQVCGAVPHTVSGLDGEFAAYAPACIGHQCVLVHQP